MWWDLPDDGVNPLQGLFRIFTGQQTKILQIPDLSVQVLFMLVNIKVKLSLVFN
jgi:hypothetical protein